MMRMTDPLTAVELPEGGALCAVSGGLDSMCLLEMTVRQGQKQGRRVAAAHFNHQLRGAEADRDEAFVRERADWHSGKAGLYPASAAECDPGGTGGLCRRP